MRKFSFTSSQAHHAFKAAFPQYKNDPSWIAVAECLFGVNKWKDALGINELDSIDEEEEGASEDEEEGDEQHDKLNPPTLQQYLSQLGDQEEDDQADGLEWLRIYVNSNPCNGGGGEELAEENIQLMEGKVVADEENATTLVNALSKEQRRCISQILLDHVHPDFRMNAISKKDLITWLTKNNARRNYFFL